MTTSSYTPITQELRTRLRRHGNIIDGEVITKTTTSSGLVLHEGFDSVLDNAQLPITTALLERAKGQVSHDWNFTIRAPKTKVEAKFDEFLKELAIELNTTVDALKQQGYRCSASNSGNQVNITFPDKDCGIKFQEMLDKGMTAKQALYKAPKTDNDPECKPSITLR